MRSLWAIERAVLEAAAHENQVLADALHNQIAAAHVTDFRNTGAGFFSTVAVSADTPRLMHSSPMDAATGSVGSIEHGMGFIVFLENGCISLIEGYTYGEASTVNVNFETTNFNIRPWSLAGE